MSVRIKVIGVVALTFVTLFIALFFISQTVIINSYNNLEQETARNNVRRILNLFESDLDSMLATTSDWAFWDAARDYVVGDYPDYVEENLFIDTIGRLNLNMMLYFNLEGELVYPLVGDLEAYEEVPLPEEFMPLIMPGSPLVALDSPEASVRGFIESGDKLMMLTSLPILNNAGEGPVNGALILARYILQPNIDAYREAIAFDLDIKLISSGEIPADILATLTDENPITTLPSSEDILLGYGLINDISGNPVAVVEASLPRGIYQRGQETLRLFATLLVVTGLVLSVVMAVLLEVVVISRVTRLSNEVNEIQTEGALSKHVTVRADDEVTSLSRNINDMLMRLDENRQQLEFQNKELQLAYEEAEASTRLKSEFLSTMSHELRTPLNAIIGYAGLMLEGFAGDLDEDTTKMVSNINDSGEHLLKLINDILDLSKIEAGRFEIVPVDFEVSSTFNNLKRQMQVLSERKGIAFDLEITPRVPTNLNGDKDRIIQVAINLISNAIKFTDVGVVDLKLDYTPDNLFVMTVRDTGTGIPPHALTYIFDAFRQVDGSSARKHQGTGLGLSIVKKLVEAMQGDITVESKLEEGSTFTVTLPLKPVLLQDARAV